MGLKLKDFLLLSLLTAGALLVHGYHPWAEDAAIYLPGVEKILHPELFPFNAQFFESHAHLTFFPNLIAAFVRVSHLPLEVVLFVVQLISIFLFLLACWQLMCRCFPDENARWAGVTLIAALLTLPVAGTALYVMDQYVNPRNLVAFAAIFAIVKVIDEKYLQAASFSRVCGGDSSADAGLRSFPRRRAALRQGIRSTVRQSSPVSCHLESRLSRHRLPIIKWRFPTPITIFCNGIGMSCWAQWRRFQSCGGSVGSPVRENYAILTCCAAH